MVHANYLVNLAASDAALREQSVAAFRGEVERAAAIGAEYLVVYPGSERPSESASTSCPGFPGSE